MPLGSADSRSGGRGHRRGLGPLVRQPGRRVVRAEEGPAGTVRELRPAGDGGPRPRRVEHNPRNNRMRASSRRPLLAEAAALVPHRLDPVRADLPAQVADVHVDDVGPRVEVDPHTCASRRSRVSTLPGARRNTSRSPNWRAESSTVRRSSETRRSSRSIRIPQADPPGVPPVPTSELGRGSSPGAPRRQTVVRVVVGATFEPSSGPRPRPRGEDDQLGLHAAGWSPLEHLTPSGSAGPGRTPRRPRLTPPRSPRSGAACWAS